MAASMNMQGVVVVTHGVDIGQAANALRAWGATVSANPEGALNIHLVSYGDALAVITNPDAAPTAWLRTPPNPAWLVTAVQTAVELLVAQQARNESAALLEICRTMGSVHELDALNRLIVRKARELTNADAGSLYLLESADGERQLRFAVAQTGPQDAETHTGEVLALTDSSIAGCVAMSGKAIRVSDVYADLPSEHIAFDSSFDRSTGYHTKSVLCVPVRDANDRIAGVLQLINRKPTFEAVLPAGVLTTELVVPFDEHDEELLTALAAQAGVLLENARLIRSSSE